jgi:hypothetical protein
MATVFHAGSGITESLNYAQTALSLTLLLQVARVDSPVTQQWPTRQVDALQQHVQGIGTHAGDNSWGPRWAASGSPGSLSMMSVLVFGEEVEICTPSSASVPG